MLLRSQEMKTHDNPLPDLGLLQIYRDERLLVVDKPHGLLMHPSWLDKGQPDTLVGRVKRLFGREWQPVHRLDRPTSGLVIFSQEPALTTWLQANWSQQQKLYWAVVRGFAPQVAEVDYPLAPIRDDIADAGTLVKPAVAAVSRLVSLAETELPIELGRYRSVRYSLLALTPVTGRQHQLRRHLKHIFHPIVGDTTYGEGRHNRLQRELAGVQHLMLRAVGLRLQRPEQPPLSLRAPLPPSWQRLLTAYQLDYPLSSQQSDRQEQLFF